MRFLKKEIKPANYAKINHLLGVFVPQTTKSKEELFLSNVSNMVIVSKMISIPNEDLSDDTTLSVVRKFQNELRARVFENTSESMKNTSGTSVTPHVDKPKLCVVTSHSKKLNAMIPSHSVPQPREFNVVKHMNLRAWVFENTSESMKNTSGTSVTPHVDKPKLCVVTSHSKKLNAMLLSHSVPQPREFNVVKHRNVIAPGMFKINPSQTPRVDLVPNKQSSASIRTDLITIFQCHVIVKENVSSNTVTASSTWLVHTARTRRPQPKGNTRNARVPSASKRKITVVILVREIYPRGKGHHNSEVIQ
nr:hypothetical protein [Tanacetum cinerariifolium]